ncbi:MAG: hypothetical protein HC930_01045 [Hydrococcus sp. SU_1_0]|nr:hypothetical protein [Hydrococcus sp. SU_1_0]
MIPNKLRFDLDLQDLPVRATQVASEALGLTGGYCFKTAISDINGVPLWTGHVKGAVEKCRKICGDDYPVSITSQEMLVRSYPYLTCKCCKSLEDSDRQ